MPIDRISKGGTKMVNRPQSYLLQGGAAELERLRLQARVWEPEAEALLDRIGVPEGATCLDLGCGGMGILGPLSKRVGEMGRVVGVDTDDKQLEAARAYVEENGLTNVEIHKLDAYNTGLPAGSFDLVHVRFVFAPVGRDEELLAEMLRLTKPDGIMAIQEPDATPWNCFPPSSAWDRLKAAVLEAFRLGGGDFNVGQRTYQMLLDAGLHDVQMRAAVIALYNAHPYMRLPIQFATSLRPRILGGGLLTEADLDSAMSECEEIVRKPDTSALTFIVTQVWGRKA
jgi:ubiquinone/menaquinone biosynthesis C-methylase UbiE